MPAEREISHGEKDDYQPEGGEPKKKEYPPGQVGTHGSKKVMGFSQVAGLDSDYWITRMVRKKAYTQNDGNEHKNDAPYFLPDGCFICSGFACAF